MTPKELKKIKELYMSDASNTVIQKAWSKLWAETEDGVVLTIAEIGAKLYKHSYRPYYHSSHIKIADLPEFWNNQSLFLTKKDFKERYLYPIIQENIQEIELRTLNILQNKYRGTL